MVFVSLATSSPPAVKFTDAKVAGPEGVCIAMPVEGGGWRLAVAKANTSADANAAFRGKGGRGERPGSAQRELVGRVALPHA